MKMSSFEEAFPSLKGKCVDSSGYCDLYDSEDISKHTIDRQRIMKVINEHCYQAYNGDMVVDCDKFMEELGLEDE